MAVRTIGTDIKLTGEKEFNDGMKAINSNLKTLRTDMAAVAATFEDSADSTEALTEKNKILQNSVEQQRVKVDALRQMYEKVAAASGENSAAADKYKQQLNQATVALAKEERALRQNNDALNDAARATDTASDELEDMADNAERAGSILPGIAQGFGSIAAGAAQAGAAIMAVGAGLGTATIVAMVSFAKESAEAAKAAAEAGEALTETQQAWVAYADNLGNLDNAMSKAKRALGGILLPQLRELSTDGAVYLNNFAQSMEEAAGDTEKQAQVISEYMSEGAKLLLNNLPEYIETGKVLLGGVKDGFLAVAPEIWATAGPMLREFLSGLGEYGPQVIEAIVTGISDSLPNLGTAAGKITGELVSYLLDPGTLGSIADAAWNIGEAIATAIWNGLKALFRKIVDIPGLVEGMNTFQQYQMTGTVGPTAIPGYSDGLDRVPYDNYLARLHKDEMVLTAAEAALYRSGRGEGRPILSPNITIYTQHLTDEEIGRILDTIDRKLGDAM